MLELKDFEEAQKRLENTIHFIPLSYSTTFSNMTNAQVYLKCENQQKTGSFKVRGASNKIIKRYEEGNLKAVVASSAGNHAQGVAYAASCVGIPSTIVMPETTPLAKVSATKGYGANVVLSGSIYDEAYAKACQICKESHAEFIHPFDDEDVIAGQGTIGLEILKDLPSVDMVFVPAGGGGLIAGIATCIKKINPRVKIIGVQAQGASAIVQSFYNQKLTSSDSVKTIADGIAVKTPGTKTFQYIQENVDEMVTVTDDEIASTILMLLERCKLVVETAGAASLAAVLNKKIDVEGKKVVCVLSGGNIDVSLIHKIVEKGLISRCRRIKFSTLLNDKPGALEHLLHIIRKQNANIIQVYQGRTNMSLGIGEVLVEIECETDGKEHADALFETLKKEGYSIHN